MHEIALRTQLDQVILDEILELIEAARRIEGHRPVGEHKYAHLRVGVRNWIGVLAYEQRRLIGYAHTRWNGAGDRPRVAVEVVVHPDRYGSGVASTLLRQTREVLARAGGGLLYLWVHRVEDARETLAARLGFEVQRELAFMTLPLRTRHADVPFPAGVTVRGYREGEDDAEFLRVNNAAFEGHPENGGWNAAEFADRRGREWFDPEGLLMAWRGEELLGFHWTKWHAHQAEDVPVHEPIGEVYVLAVDPAAQGMGLGSALLAAGLQHLYDRGCAQAVLYVDCASTGAVALYESEGFQTAYREVCYQDWVQPAGTLPASDLLRPAEA
ncbi:MAG: mycothiol synthase [Egibacteraceae bacterium]